MKYETISLCFLYEDIKNIMKILKLSAFVYVATIIHNNTYPILLKSKSSKFLFLTPLFSIDI